jgi:hypothetical protein
MLVAAALNKNAVTSWIWTWKMQELRRTICARVPRQSSERTGRGIDLVVITTVGKNAEFMDIRIIPGPRHQADVVNAALGSKGLGANYLGSGWAVEDYGMTCQPSSQILCNALAG